MPTMTEREIFKRSIVIEKCFISENSKTRKKKKTHAENVRDFVVGYAATRVRNYTKIATVRARVSLARFPMPFGRICTERQIGKRTPETDWSNTFHSSSHHSET